MNLQSFNIQTQRLTMAGLKNDCTSGVPVIALHGWLDNAASFIPICEKLILDRPFYALEMPGHGLTEHRPKSASYHMVDNILDILAFIETVCEQDSVSGQAVTLIGHSLGGIICSLVAAAAPDKIAKLVMLDSLGPLTDETENVLPQLRKAIKKAMQLSSSRLTVYPSKEMAAVVRMSGVGKVSKRAATLLVERGLKEVSGGYSWSSDSRLLEPSLLRFSEAQTEAVYSGIECPVCLISGDKGYFASYKRLKHRLSYLDKTKVEKHIVAGGHHFHMDGDVQGTAEIIYEFIK